MAGDLLERTKEFDFLGLTTNEKLNRNAHINKITNKIAHATGILKKTAKLPTHKNSFTYL